MDAFKLALVVTLIISGAAIGVVGVLGEQCISNSTLPDSETGFVTSKVIVADNLLATSQITLSTGKSLYIKNDTLLYSSIVENHTYTFDCLLNYKAGMLMVQEVNPKAGLVVSKENTGKGVADYTVSLSNGRNLYIANNATLYNLIGENQSYLFDCYKDYQNNIYIINSIQPLS